MKVKCPACGNVFAVTPGSTAAAVRCQCGQALKVPARAATTAPYPAATKNPSPAPPTAAAAKAGSSPTGADDRSSLFDDDLSLLLDEESASKSSGATQLRPLSPPPPAQPLPKPAKPAAGSGISWSVENNGWLQTGLWLLALGVASFILPLFGLQIRRLNRLGPNAPILGGVLGFVGAALLYVSQANQPMLGLLMSGSGALVMAIVWLAVGLPKPEATPFGAPQSAAARQQSAAEADRLAPKPPDMPAAANPPTAPSHSSPPDAAAATTVPEMLRPAPGNDQFERSMLQQHEEAIRRAEDAQAQMQADIDASRRRAEERHRERMEQMQARVNRPGFPRPDFDRPGFRRPGFDDVDSAESSLAWPTVVDESAADANPRRLRNAKQPLPKFDYDKAAVEQVSLKSDRGADAAVVEDRAPEGGVLVGLRIATGADWGGAVQGIQPIYQVAGRYREGQWCGNQAETETLLLAKPGYVIGNIRVRAGLVIDSLQVAFVAVEDGQLQPLDQYASPPIGSDGGGEQPHPDAPSFIVGLSVGAGDDALKSLGFYAVKEMEITAPRTAANEERDSESPEEAETKPPATRTWSSADGKFTVEARLVGVVANRAVLRRPDGRIVRVPLDKLSEEDQQFIKSR